MQFMNNSNNNQNNFFQQFQQFQKQLESLNKTPEQFLYELKASGKVTQEQINQATQMAKMAQSLFR